MPSEDTKLLEFNQCHKFDEALFIIYANLECIIEKIDRCKNNPENRSTIKIREHSPSDFSMSIISSFRSIENRHDVYRGNDCMETFFESLREYVIKIIDFKREKNEIINKRTAAII